MIFFKDLMGIGNYILCNLKNIFHLDHADEKQEIFYLLIESHLLESVRLEFYDEMKRRPTRNESKICRNIISRESV